MKSIRGVPVFLIVLYLIYAPPAVHAQFAGANLKSDMGLASGSQAPPGIVYGSMFYNYDTSRINDKDGKQINAGGNTNIWAIAPLVSVVTNKKFLGANYGFMVAVPILNAILETPRFVSNPSADVSDLYVVPIQLGWHLKQADVTASYDFFAPTGRYSAGASDNTGLGMWSHEANVGATVYFDKNKAWHAATNAAFEFHTEKKGTTPPQQVGNLLTLEGGFGRSLGHGAIKVGVAYYSQWKLSDDKLGGGLPGLLVTGRNSATALGPEFSFPIVAKGKLYSIITARYEWEAYSQTTTQGNAFFMTAVFPLKPVKVGATP
jgi:hypothetical protein